MSTTSKLKAKKVSRGPWYDWAKSQHGKHCLDGSSIGVSEKNQQYLENRLWHAFIAGMKAEGEIRDEHNE